MPIRYEIDPALPLVRSYLSGHVSADEVIAHYDRLASDPHFDPSFWHLADIRELASFSGDADAIRTAVRRRVFNQGVRRAILFQDLPQRAIAEEFALHAQAAGHVMAIFDDARSAEMWLWSVKVLPPEKSRRS